LRTWVAEPGMVWYPKIMPESNTRSRNCNCAFCKDNRDFDLPVQLIDDLLTGNVVLFAGAGISTEGSNVFPRSLYEEVKDTLSNPDQETGFPETMSQFCRQPNGRSLLIRKIHERFKKVATIRETFLLATRFHQALATLFPLQLIVTTNWDDYFETECDAIPLVIPEDLAFWRLPGRKVLKIHGSINNLGSIVVTAEDYQQCHDRLREGVLGSTLKTLLATRTVLYAGYSFRDPDFLQLLNLLRSEMGELMPAGYAITTDEGSISQIKELDLVPILTDATRFVEVVKGHLVEAGRMVPDQKYDMLVPARAYLVEVHHNLANRYDPRKQPALVFALAYQDGMIHAFDVIGTKRRLGYFSEAGAAQRMLGKYANLSACKLYEEQYHDVAYIDGFAAGLLFFIDVKKATPIRLPAYYIYGLGNVDQPPSLEEFEAMLPAVASKCPEAYAQAERIANALPDGIVIHHRAWL